jgi:integrase/recombinase XerD
MVNKLPSVLSKEELLRLVSIMDDLRMVVITFIGTFMGLRIGEIIKLEWSDIDLVYGELKVRDGKNPYRFRTGYGKDRIVPVNDMFLPILKKWRMQTGSSPYVIPRKRHGNKKEEDTTRGWQAKFHRYLKKAGLEEVTGYQRNGFPRYKHHLHTLRHVCGTNLYRCGMDIYQIKEFLGHSNIDTTKIYCELAKDDLRAAAHKALAYPKSIVEEQPEIMVTPDPEVLKLQNENLKMMLKLKEVEVYAQR